MNTLHVSTWNSRFGPFTAIAHDDTVWGSGWTPDADELLRLFAPSDRTVVLRRVRHLGAVRDAVDRFDSGAVDAIDHIRVHQTSGEFHAEVRDRLRAIPPGTTLSYAGLAAAAGRPRAFRAAGSACARNATSLFVPCHRAIGTNGSLHAFGWGLDRKAALLAHESKAAGS